MLGYWASYLIIKQLKYGREQRNDDDGDGDGDESSIMSSPLDRPFEDHHRVASSIYSQQAIYPQTSTNNIPGVKKAEPMH